MARQARYTFRHCKFNISSTCDSRHPAQFALFRSETRSRKTPGRFYKCLSGITRPVQLLFDLLVHGLLLAVDAPLVDTMDHLG